MRDFYSDFLHQKIWKISLKINLKSTHLFIWKQLFWRGVFSYCFFSWGVGGIQNADALFKGSGWQKCAKKYWLSLWKTPLLSFSLVFRWQFIGHHSVTWLCLCSALWSLSSPCFFCSFYSSSFSLSWGCNCSAELSTFPTERLLPTSTLSPSPCSPSFK